MANAVITFKIMPDGLEADFNKIKETAKKLAEEAGAKGNMLIDEQPIAFGLKSIIIKAMYKVEGGNFEAIAEKMSKIEGVQTAEVISMDLPLG